jgi:hypothetical protein
MSASDPATVILQATDLGAPAAPDATACSANAIGLLAAAAGPDMRLSSLSLDVTSHPLAAGPVTVTISIDKRARSIIFASCEARAGDTLVFAAQALFSRAG